MAGKLITALTAASGGELAATSVLAGMAAAGTEARKFTVTQLASILNLGSLAGVFTTTGAFTLNLNASANTNVTLPTTGTLAALGGANSWTATQLFTATNASTNQSGGATPGIAFVGFTGNGIDVGASRTTFFAGGYPLLSIRSDNNQVEIAASAAYTWAGGADIGAAPDTSIVRDAAGVFGSPGSVRVLNATSIPAGGTAGSGYKFSSTANFGVFFGSGAPSLVAAKGSLYLRSDGSGIADRAYIATDGTGTWTAIATAG